MTDDLRDAMATEVGEAPAPPLRGAWALARRRDRRRRMAVIGVPMASAAALVGGLVLVGAHRDETPAADPRPCGLVEADGRDGPIEEVAPPRDAEDMVTRTTDAVEEGHLLGAPPSPPPIVARIRIERVDGSTPNESGVVGTGFGELTATVQDVVQPRTAPTRLTIVRSIDAQLADLASVKQQLMDQIDELQDRIDGIDAPLLLIDVQLAKMAQDDPRFEGLLVEREREKQRTDPDRLEVQQELEDHQQRLQVLQLSERLVTGQQPDFACHRVRPGDDLIVALARSGDTYHLATPGSFFVVEDDGELSPDLEALRRSVPEWDTELVEQASQMDADELMDLLRQASDATDGD